MQTIEDYLEVKDWAFKASFSTGQNGEYYWVILDSPDLKTEFLIWPQKSLSTVLLSFDGSDTGCSFGSSKNWRAVAGIAVSDLILGPPELSYGAEFELLILDRELTDQELKAALTVRPDKTDLDNIKFWQFLERLQPLCYVADTYQSYFMSKDKTMVEALHSKQALERIEEDRKRGVQQNRLELWSMLGPECGPEKCVEEHCDRQRIELAMRCFIHQLAPQS